MSAYRKPSQPTERAPKRRVVVTLADAPDEPRRWKREASIALSKEAAASTTRERTTEARIRYALQILGMIFELLTIW
jgi:hypothetical protein